MWQARIGSGGDLAAQIVNAAAPWPSCSIPLCPPQPRQGAASAGPWGGRQGCKVTVATHISPAVDNGQ